MTSNDTRPETEKRRVAVPRASRGRPIATTSVRAPVVAAVESATARATAEVAAQLAHELKAPLTFVHVRPRRPAVGGSARSQRQSARALLRAHTALDAALPVATRWGVMAQGEIVDGDPIEELVDVATRRKARLLVVGSRGRRFRRSVSRGVLEASTVPVVVAHAHPR
jgi:nucleotide-binding universal stress UspA family protein